MFTLTIIIPFYNTIDYLPETLSSIMNQKNVNFDKLQILLINDGSNYDLQPMVQSFSQLHIEYHKKNNANWGSVINYCKNNKLIKGKYVTIIDSDDIYWPNRLHFLTDALENGQEDMVVANLYRWRSKANRKGRISTYINFGKTQYQINKHTLRKLHTPISVPICKCYTNALFHQLPDLKENVPYEDIFLYFTLLHKAKTLHYVDKYVGAWRVDRAESSSNMAWTQMRVDCWIHSIQYMDSVGNTMNAIWYALTPGFLKSYRIYYKIPFNIHGRIKNLFLPLCIAPVSKFVCWFVLHVIARRVIQKR